MQKTNPDQPDPVGGLDDAGEPDGTTDGNGAHDDGLDPREIEQDPSHEPEEEGLKDLKGG